jgi:ribonuclease P/MRP protein subunit RPP1
MPFLRFFNHALDKSRFYSFPAIKFMPFYDLHVCTSDTTGENTIEEMSAWAKRLGLAGIGIIHFPEHEPKPLPKKDIDLISVALIKAPHVDEVKGLIDKMRDKVEIIAVMGGNYDINRASCENPAVDILCSPEKGRTDSGLDHICARAAQENNVAIEINFHEVLEAYKRQRVRELSALRKNIMLCRQYEAPIITTSGAMTKWDLRAGRDLAALPALLGLELGKAIETISSKPEEIIKRNREKLVDRAWERVRMVN